MWAHRAPSNFRGCLGDAAVLGLLHRLHVLHSVLPQELLTCLLLAVAPVDPLRYISHAPAEGHPRFWLLLAVSDFVGISFIASFTEFRISREHLYSFFHGVLGLSSAPLFGCLARCVGSFRRSFWASCLLCSIFRVALARCRNRLTSTLFTCQNGIDW